MTAMTGLERALLNQITTRGYLIEMGDKRAGAYLAELEAEGWRGISIDLDAQGPKCRKLDLTKALTLEDIGEHADLVTNFGTAEHVMHQPMFWRNVDFCLKEGGFLVSTCPSQVSVDEWAGHGLFWQTLEWWAVFSLVNKYEILNWGISGIQRSNLFCVLRKKQRSDPRLTMPPAALMYVNPHGGKVGSYA